MIIIGVFIQDARGAEFWTLPQSFGGELTGLQLVFYVLIIDILKVDSGVSLSCRELLLCLL